MRARAPVREQNLLKSAPETIGRLRSIVICLYFTNSPGPGGARIAERSPGQPIFRPIGTTIPT